MSPIRQGRWAYYGSEHLERIAKIRDFQSSGLSLRDIEMRLGESRNEPHEIRPRGELLDFDTFAISIGMPAPLVRAMIAEGVLMPLGTGSAQRFSAQDVRMAELALRLLGEGLPFSDLIALSKAHHARMEETIAASIELFEKYLRVKSHDAGEDDYVTEFKTFEILHEALVELVALHFARLLLVRAQERLTQSGSPDELQIVKTLAQEMMSR